VAEIRFTIARVQYVRGTDGEAERDDYFFPTSYTSLEDALEVVLKLNPTRYVIDDHPRQGMFPAWSGWPDQADEELARRKARAA